MKSIEKFEEGKVYYCINYSGMSRYSYIFRATDDNNSCHHIQIEKDGTLEYNNAGWFVDQEEYSREATQLEVLWLQQCEKKGKLVPKPITINTYEIY